MSKGYKQTAAGIVTYAISSSQRDVAALVLFFATHFFAGN
jgi:hypothetical protein